MALTNNDNAYALAGRMAKAEKIGAVLLAGGYRSAQVSEFNEEQRILAAGAARCAKKGNKPPSDETWELVVGLMRRMESAQDVSRSVPLDAEKIFSTPFRAFRSMSGWICWEL